MRVRRITQDFTPVDLPFPGFGGKFRVFQRFLRVFRLRFNLLWIEWFRTLSCHRCYPCLYGHEQNIGMVTSTLRVTPFNGFSVTQSRPRGKSLACCKVRSWGKLRRSPGVLPTSASGGKADIVTPPHTASATASTRSSCSSERAVGIAALGGEHHPERFKLAHERCR